MLYLVKLGTKLRIPLFWSIIFLFKILELGIYLKIEHCIKNVIEIREKKNLIKKQKKEGQIKEKGISKTRTILSLFLEQKLSFSS